MGFGDPLEMSLLLKHHQYLNGVFYFKLRINCRVLEFVSCDFDGGFDLSLRLRCA